MPECQVLLAWNGQRPGVPLSPRPCPPTSTSGPKRVNRGGVGEGLNPAGEGSAQASCIVECGSGVGSGRTPRAGCVDPVCLVTVT